VPNMKMQHINNLRFNTYGHVHVYLEESCYLSLEPGLRYRSLSCQVHSQNSYPYHYQSVIQRKSEKQRKDQVQVFVFKKDDHIFV